jgi:hypothetical protein
MGTGSRHRGMRAPAAMTVHAVAPAIFRREEARSLGPPHFATSPPAGDALTYQEADVVCLVRTSTRFLDLLGSQVTRRSSGSRQHVCVPQLGFG